MRLLPLTLMVAAIAASVAMAASGPAAAATSCTCTSILPSGHCIEYGNCHVLEMSVPVPTLKPIRSAKECRKSQVLICDYSACKVVCDPSKK
jgi:hypothetical protein